MAPAAPAESVEQLTPLGNEWLARRDADIKRPLRRPVQSAAVVGTGAAWIVSKRINKFIASSLTARFATAKVQ